MGHSILPSFYSTHVILLLVRCRASGERSTGVDGDPMATYRCTDCVHWHKMKINVSLYRKLLFLQLMWLKVQSFITLFILLVITRGLQNAYIGAVTRRGSVIIDI